MTDEQLLEIIEEKIISYSGLNLARIQKDRIVVFLKQKAADKGIEVEEFVTTLKEDSEDFKEIITKVTVNETYFFREQLQFEFLKEKIFPKFAGRKINIWSAACSTGEEPISILALANECGVDADVYASDIDDNALGVLRKGIYSAYSFRNDGRNYKDILYKYGKETEAGFEFSPVFLKKISTFNFNLIQGPGFPFDAKLDVVFVRNVFIYFDKETRLAVIKKIAASMADNGILLFSMSEVGSFGTELNAYGLNKTNYGSLYYYVKGQVEKPVAVERTERRRPVVAEKKSVQEIRQERKKEKIENENENKVKLTGYSKESMLKAYEAITALVNKRNFDGAMEYAKEYEKLHETKACSKYFQGYIKYQADEKEEAAKCFEACKMLKPDFWPAYFYNGMVLRDMGKYGTSCENFSECMSLLEKAGQSADEYDFVLDSFDPAYIYNLCKTLLKSGDRN